METVEIHSKDYLVRWVHGDANTTVTWKVSPDKRSINFGVFVHDEEVAGGIQLSKSTGSVKEKLEKSGFKPLMQEGIIRVEGKETAEGSAFLDKSIMLAFVFDNTFSISNSKHVRFSFNSRPEVSLLPQQSPSAQPQPSSPLTQHESPVLKQQSTSNNASAESLVPVTSNENKSVRKFPDANSKNLSDPPAVSGSTSLQSSAAAAAMKGSAPSLASINTRNTTRNRTMSMSSRADSARPIRRNTTASFATHMDDEDPHHGVTRVRTRQGTSVNTSDNELQRSADGRFVSGYLHKKRRKQFQGFARRYFTLDKVKGLLTYYLNSRSGSLRGVMPIKIVEITTDNRNLQLTLDSGMEKWTVKANDPSTYDAWYNEIKQLRSTNSQAEDEDEDEDDTEMNANANSEAAAAAAAALSSTRLTSSPSQKPRHHEHSLPAPAHLMKHYPALHHLRDSIVTLPAGSYRETLEQNYRDLIKEAKRTHSTADRSGNDDSNNSARSDSSCSSSSGNAVAYAYPSESSETTLDLIKRQINSNNFMIVSGVALISSVLVGFTFTLAFVVIIVGSIAGRLVSFTEPPTIPQGSVHSSDSDTASNYSSLPSPTQDFENSESEYDASGSEDEDNNTTGGGDASIRKSTTNDSSTDTTVSYVPQNVATSPTSGEPSEVSGRSAETSLYPLPHTPVERRTNVTSPMHPPPSIMSLLKKAKQNGNMGAPITTNEPMSGVQTIAELFENSDLLDRAAAAEPRSNERVILVALFQVARIASMRVKERSMRKPFTPLLGESFEMVREDLGFRYVSEKVLHKPEVIATQTESTNWTVHFTSRPHTKMWAKSAQLTDVGTFCVAFPDGEKVSFINPEMFIRNILAGERYVEPSGTVIVESSAGTHATVEYKAGGMFSGRSEEVTITSGKLVYEGKWTESIRHGSEVVWKAKPTVADASKHYGWTLFCAQLNEITPIEQGQLPPNDSRLRPDLKLYEEQTDVEKAETIKLELEQHQRERRSVMERQKKQHEPFFFRKTNDANGHYVLHKGRRNYWVMREQQNWDAIPHYFK